MPKSTVNIEAPTSRTARRQRAGAARARSWRASRKEQGIPLPRDADAAIAEAMSFLLARSRRDGVNIEAVGIRPTEIGLLARIILERDGFDAEHSGSLVIQRLGRRDDHLRPLYVPSLRPSDDIERLPMPEKGWSMPLKDMLDYVQGKFAVTSPE